MSRYQSRVELKVGTSWKARHFDLDLVTRVLAYRSPDVSDDNDVTGGCNWLSGLLSSQGGAIRNTLVIHNWFRIPSRPGQRQHRVDITSAGGALLQMNAVSEREYGGWCAALESMAPAADLSTHPLARFSAPASTGTVPAPSDGDLGQGGAGAGAGTGGLGKTPGAGSTQADHRPKGPAGAQPAGADDASDAGSASGGRTALRANGAAAAAACADDADDAQSNTSSMFSPGKSDFGGSSAGGGGNGSTAPRAEAGGLPGGDSAPVRHSNSGDIERQLKWRAELRNRTETGAMLKARLTDKLKEEAYETALETHALARRELSLDPELYARRQKVLLPPGSAAAAGGEGGGEGGGEEGAGAAATAATAEGATTSTSAGEVSPAGGLVGDPPDAAAGLQGATGTGAGAGAVSSAAGAAAAGTGSVPDGAPAVSGIPAARVRPWLPRRPHGGFLQGDAVEVNYQRWGNWFKGTVVDRHLEVGTSHSFFYNNFC